MSSPTRANVFYPAIRKYWPGLADNALRPAYSGIRPKLEGLHGSQTQDFVIQGQEVHGWTGLINLYGIESPGLTASLALANEVCRKLGV